MKSVVREKSARHVLWGLGHRKVPLVPGAEAEMPGSTLQSEWPWALVYGGRWDQPNENLFWLSSNTSQRLERSERSLREWVCCECGVIHDRDINAALNIFRTGCDTLASEVR